MEGDISNVLTVSEQQALDQNDAVIEAGLQTFFDVGTALLDIRDQRLYREQFATFEDYCQQRWGMQRAHAYRMIEAAKVMSNLSPIGDILPENEYQARPLTRLSSEDQQAAWQQVVETAPKDDDAALLQEFNRLPTPQARQSAIELVRVFSDSVTAHFAS